MEKEKNALQAIERDLCCFVLAAGPHDREKILLCLPQRWISDPEEIKFPIRWTRIESLREGFFVARPAGVDSWIALIQEESGEGGWAEFFNLEGDFEIMATGKKYHSPNGNAGETAWGLVNVRGPQLIIHAKSTGRKARGEYAYMLFPNGETREIRRKDSSIIPIP
jgi:hypothetical protein